MNHPVKLEDIHTIVSDVFGVILLEGGLNLPYLAWLQTQKEAGKRIAFGSNVSVERAALLLQKNEINQISTQFFSSGALGIAKPDVRFFQSIEKELNVTDPTQILFIDDSYANTVAASTCAWQTHTYISQTELTKLVK